MLWGLHDRIIMVYDTKSLTVKECFYSPDYMNYYWLSPAFWLMLHTGVHCISAYSELAILAAFTMWQKDDWQDWITIWNKTVKDRPYYLSCIAGKEKSGFILLPTSENNCMKFVYIVNCFIAWMVSWEVWTQLVPLQVLCWLSFPTPPPTHLYLGGGGLILGESYICMYTKSWKTIPQYTVSLSLSFVTHCFSLHHH